jgi:hypothetical protein
VAGATAILPSLLRGRLLHTSQQVIAIVVIAIGVIAIGADALAQRLSLRRVFRQALVVHLVPIPLIPLGRDLLLEPVWRHGRQDVQRRAPCLSDELERT